MSVSPAKSSACLTVFFRYMQDYRFFVPFSIVVVVVVVVCCCCYFSFCCSVWILERISQLNFMTTNLFKRTNILLVLLTFQISTNAMKPARIMPTPTAPTHQVHMSASARTGTKRMVITVKVRSINLFLSPNTATRFPIPPSPFHPITLDLPAFFFVCKCLLKSLIHQDNT